MGFPILVSPHLYIESGSCSSYWHICHSCWVSKDSHYLNIDVFLKYLCFWTVLVSRCILKKSHKNVTWFASMLMVKRIQPPPPPPLNYCPLCDAIWHHRSRSPLAQVMASCLMAPSHHLNLCRLIMYKFIRHSLGNNFTGMISTG